MSGARPLYLAAAFILEEGLAADDLRRVVESMRDAANEAGVLLVTGDTKVVNRGKGDQVFITTTGLGVIDRPVEISADRARPGDKIILSGFIGDHGMAIMSQRENLEFEGAIESDCAPLHGLVSAMLEVTGSEPASADTLLARSNPRRRGHHLERNRRAVAGRNAAAGTRVFRCARQSKGACEISGTRPAVRGQRRQAARDCGRGSERMRLSGKCVSTRWAAMPS